MQKQNFTAFNTGCSVQFTNGSRNRPSKSQERETMANVERQQILVESGVYVHQKQMLHNQSVTNELHPKKLPSIL